MIKIYYFSGTGNTLWSAKKIAEIIGGETGRPDDIELFNIGIEAQKEEIVLEADAVILLFPSYGYGLPVVVRRFVQKAEFKTPHVASFVTYGSSPGGTMSGLSLILKKKGVGKVFFDRIPAVENYIPLFGAQKEETIQQRLEMQKEKTEAAARSVIEKQTNRVNIFRPFSAFVWCLFTLGMKIFYKYFRVSAECDGCGVCEKVCPVSAVSIREARPVFSSKCEHCQACLNWCHKNAIHFGRLKEGVPRYRHPEIALAEMEKRNGTS